MNDELEPQLHEDFERILELHQIRLLRQQNFERPAVNLPAELLSIIFELFCWGSRGTNIQRCIAYSKSLRTLCHVCSRWTDTAQSTSSLWSTASISLRAQSFVHAGLSRSNNRPLLIHLNLVDWRDTEAACVLRRLTLLPILTPFTPRFDVLLVDSWLWGVNREHSIATDFSGLRQLVLRSRDNYVDAAWCKDIIDLTRATSLLDAHIDFHHEEFCIGDCLPRVRVPMSWTVRRLHLNGVNPKCAIDAIDSCEQLEYLSWHSDRRFDEIPWDRVTMPGDEVLPVLNDQLGLRYLELSGDIPIVLGGHIYAPGVFNLFIDDAELGPNAGDPDDTFHPLDHPLCDSYPALVELTILGDPSRRPVDIAAFLREHKLLQKVTLGFHLTDPLVECLGGMPNLASLTLTGDEDIMDERDCKLYLVEKLLQFWAARSTRVPSLFISSMILASLEGATLVEKYPEAIIVLSDEARRLSQSSSWDQNVL